MEELTSCGRISYFYGYDGATGNVALFKQLVAILKENADAVADAICRKTETEAVIVGKGPASSPETTPLDGNSSPQTAGKAGGKSYPSGSQTAGKADGKSYPSGSQTAGKADGKSYPSGSQTKGKADGKSYPSGSQTAGKADGKTKGKAGEKTSAMESSITIFLNMTCTADKKDIDLVWDVVQQFDVHYIFVVAANDVYAAIKGSQGTESKVFIYEEKMSVSTQKLVQTCITLCLICTATLNIFRTVRNRRQWSFQAARVQ
jgi:hypothetical protein